MRAYRILLLIYLFVLSATSDEDFEDDDDSHVEEQPTEAEESKEAYVPPQFVPPAVEGSPMLVEWFGDKDVIGKKWHKSTAKKDDVEEAIAKYNGEWAVEAPTVVVIEGDLGLVVKTKARHHAIAAQFDRPFQFDGKPLVVQYEVKYEDGQECGGGYVKLLTVGAEKSMSNFHDKTPYTIMFGPDKCGQTAKVHFIVRFKNPKNGTIAEHHAKQSSKSVSSYFDDHKTHLYTLIVSPDDTFSVSVDNKNIMSGSLLSDVEPPITPPREIDDPEDKKPADWDEREKIVDPDAKKPDDWDENAPKEIIDESAKKPDDWLEDEEDLIADPEAKRPDDWDDGMDGEWEAPKVQNPKCKGISGCGKWNPPKIANPAYKGKWHPPKIANPNYKGKWAPRQIENPHFFEPRPYAQLLPITALGIELWTMSSGIVFDNIYVGDDVSAAKKFAEQTFGFKSEHEQLFDHATTKSKGWWAQLVSATEERPWLWAVYVLSVLLPVIIIAIACFGRKSKPIAAATYKKTDEPQPDEDVPNLVGDDEDVVEEAAGDSVKEVEHETESDNRKPESAVRRRAAKTKEDLEDDDSESQSQSSAAEAEPEDVDEKALIEGHSAKGKRVRQRKQD